MMDKLTQRLKESLIRKILDIKSDKLDDHYMTTSRGSFTRRELAYEIEYEWNVGIKCEVITLPKLNESGQYEWKSKNINSGKIIDYLVDPKYSHYSSKLYDYEAYKVNVYI